MSKLAALVAERVMNVQPRITLEVSNDGGKSSAFGNGDWSTSHIDVYEWLAEQQAEGVMKDYKVVEWKHYPRYDTKIEDAWEVVRHMRTQNYLLRLIDQHHKTGTWDCRFYKFPESTDIEYQQDANECIAICLAALRAVGMTDAEIGEALR